MTEPSHPPRTRLLLIELERYKPGAKAEHPPLVRNATGDRLLTRRDTWRAAAAVDVAWLLGVLRWGLER